MALTSLGNELTIKKSVVIAIALALVVAVAGIVFI